MKKMLITMCLLSICICSCRNTNNQGIPNISEEIKLNEILNISSIEQNNGSENENDTSVVHWKELQNTTTEEQRHDEIRKSMRAYYISWTEKKDDYVKSRSYLVNELQKMKADYYYEPNDSLLSLIPGPKWEIEGPLDITKVLEYFNEERESAGFRNIDIEELRKIGIDLKYSWSEFARQYKDGDEIYRYKSDLRSWGRLMGQGGYLIIRNNKIIYKLMTEQN